MRESGERGLRRSHSGNIAVSALVAEDLADILSSDYIPASAVHGVYSLHLDHGMTLPAAVATASCTPAQRVGLIDRGEIAVGRRADLIRIRPMQDVPLVRVVWVAGARVA